MAGIEGWKAKDKSKDRWTEIVESAQEFVEGHADHEHITEYERTVVLEEGDRERAMELLQLPQAKKVLDNDGILALELTIGTEGDPDNGGWPWGTELWSKMAACFFLQQIHEKQKTDEAIGELVDRVKKKGDNDDEDDDTELIVQRVQSPEELVRALRGGIQAVKEKREKKKEKGKEEPPKKGDEWRDNRSYM